MVFIKSLLSTALVASFTVQALAATTTTTKSSTTKTTTKKTTTTRTTTTKTSTSSIKTTTATTTQTTTPASPTQTLSGSGSSWSFPNWNAYTDATDSQWQSAWNITTWSYPHTTGENHNIVANPLDSSEQVLRVTYPAGSFNPSNTPIGGLGFYASPLSIPADASFITFTYEVYFPSGFNFVEGNCWYLFSNVSGMLHSETTLITSVNYCVNNRWQGSRK